MSFRRKTPTPRILLALALCLPAALQAAAKRGFVTDQLEVQMRAGQTLQHKVLKMIPSGTPVAIMGDNPGTGYSLIKLDNGEDGWVLTRYLTTEPLPRAQLEDTTRKLQAIQEDNKRLKEELAATKAGKESAEQTAQQRQTEIDRLNTEVIAIRQASASALQIQEERDSLQQHVIDLERKVDDRARDMAAREDELLQSGFLIGAGVLFGGILLGVILPRLSWRKKTSWDSF
jgi:SH3 domain protein